ncbi:hypothetical protein [Scrofimicrobium canadense]|uniref:hypothetical protein n=1 Tax=Scrofimicrobium canadense TaxID=2652290 RepID=UPI00298EA4B5|nr:hypothetical protein [Scrofimicrobium canadense]
MSSIEELRAQLAEAEAKAKLAEAELAKAQAQAAAARLAAVEASSGTSPKNEPAQDVGSEQSESNLTIVPSHLPQSPLSQALLARATSSKG